MKKTLACICLAFFTVSAFSQNITTASAFFKTISEYYGSFKSYEADAEINMNTATVKKEMACHISYKAPDLLRIDFSNPEEQVIVYSSDMLKIYVPGSDAILEQQITSENTSSAAAGMVSGQGLQLMSRYYTISYENSPDLEALDSSSDEMVMKLLLVRKTSSEAFRYIKLAISPETKLIRRIEAVTSNSDTFIFDLYDYKLNTEISDLRFIYDAPPSANNYNNFLFTE